MLPASLVGLLAPAVFTAAERAVKIASMRVPRVRQKANATMAAVDRTACQTGMVAQDRSECRLILTNKRAGAIVLMPIRAKRKELPGGDNKNARFSVKMLIVFCTPSSYELDALASRSRTRFFIGLHPIESKRTGTTPGRDTNYQPACSISFSEAVYPRNLFYLKGTKDGRFERPLATAQGIKPPR